MTVLYLFEWAEERRRRKSSRRRPQQRGEQQERRSRGKRRGGTWSEEVEEVEKRKRKETSRSWRSGRRRRRNRGWWELATIPGTDDIQYNWAFIAFSRGQVWPSLNSSQTTTLLVRYVHFSEPCLRICFTFSNTSVDSDSYRKPRAHGDIIIMAVEEDKHVTSYSTCGESRILSSSCALACHGPSNNLPFLPVIVFSANLDLLDSQAWGAM